jgi:uncharacterized membrane protein HdeD (DUF308 family)/alpha-beta hydrolase superfamily lysophospholipase
MAEDEVAGRLPRWARALLGLACVVVGVSLTTRPFTSLSVLVLLTSAAAIVTGITRWGTARTTAGRLDDLVAAGWIAVGILIAAWPDLTVRGIALVVGIAMIVGGLGDLVGGLRGTQDQRLAAVLKGAASVVFGVLALSWPDVTLLVVAVVFGIRTVLFGLSELLAAVRGDRGAPSGSDGRPGLLKRSFHLVAAAVALVVALALGSLSATLHEAEPSIGAFYDTPAEVPDEPGRLLRSEPTDQSVPDGAEGWKILYTTTTADGAPAVASGLVIVPGGVDGPLPVIGWAHGTTGVDRTCAPSLLSSGLAAGAFFLTEDVLDRGWALVATDYVGLGGEGDHPYLVGEPEARSVLDAVRAARQLDDVELAEETVVWGHSQGGGAALWTGQIAPDYAPDAEVIGVAALAPASDVAGLMSNLATMQGGSLFASYALVGYSSFYDDVDFDDYVVPTAATSVRETAERCLTAEILPSALTSAALGMSVFSGDLTTGPLADRLAENVPRGPYEMPLLIGQGEDDSLVVPTVQAAFVEGLCADGNEVDFRTYAGRDHVPLVEPDSPAVPDLLEWTQQRFDGEAFAGNCEN